MKILIFYEKHGNRYFDASSQDKIEKACLKVIKDRIKQGYYSLKPCEFLANQIKTEKPEIPYEQCLELKKGPIREAAFAQWEIYNGYLNEVEVEKEEIEDLKKIKKGNQKLAWEFAQARQNEEYEGYVIETLEEVE